VSSAAESVAPPLPADTQLQKSWHQVRWCGLQGKARPALCWPWTL